MTDKQTISSMLHKIGLKEVQPPETRVGDKEFLEEGNQINVGGGYHGFVTVFTFHTDGGLESIGAYE